MRKRELGLSQERLESLQERSLDVPLCLKTNSAVSSPISPTFRKDTAKEIAEPHEGFAERNFAKEDSRIIDAVLFVIQDSKTKRTIFRHLELENAILFAFLRKEKTSHLFCVSRLITIYVQFQRPTLMSPVD